VLSVRSKREKLKLEEKMDVETKSSTGKSQGKDLKQESKDEYFVVGTAYVLPSEDQPTKGIVSSKYKPTANHNHNHHHHHHHHHNYNHNNHNHNYNHNNNRQNSRLSSGRAAARPDFGAESCWKCLLLCIIPRKAVSGSKQSCLFVSLDLPPNGHDPKCPRTAKGV
jgi:hypothetical protein